MRRLKTILKKIGNLLPALLLGAFAAAGQGQTLVLVGNVVDQSGKPVSEALIVPEFDCPKCPDKLVFATTTGQNGQFSLDPGVGRPPQLYLFIIEAVAAGTWNPFDAQFITAGKNNFKPVILTTKNRERLELKDLRPTVSYQTSVVNLVELFGLSAETVRRQSAFVSAVISDSRGKRLYSGSVDSELVRKNPAALPIALPANREWRLSFTIRTDLAKSITKKLVPKQLPK